MQFRTKINIPIGENPIDYNSKILSLGSCFAVNMANKLDYFKFQNTSNPFGILFHPLAIEKLIDFVVSNKVFTEDDVFLHDERWHSFDVHSDWSTSNKEEFIANLNAIILSTKNYLQKSSHIIITYGTSWVYKNIITNNIVANCHKVPQKQFVKAILSVETIENSIQNTIYNIQKINAHSKIIFTISPVRHLKDGFVENQWSKAHLIAAIHKLKSLKFHSFDYFPSYEIMMDELRDYRFYTEDMIHPNQVAIDYIWEQFVKAYISVESYSIMKEVVAIQKGLQHRSFNPNSESHQCFLSKLHDRKRSLQSKFPNITF